MYKLMRNEVYNDKTKYQLLGGVAGFIVTLGTILNPYMSDTSPIVLAATHALGLTLTGVSAALLDLTGSTKERFERAGYAITAYAGVGFVTNVIAPLFIN